ncbi:hypothetical protein WJX77_007744 [Trebouxia sp. C0004]
MESASAVAAGSSHNKAMDPAPEDNSVGPCITIFTDRHEDPFVTIKNQVYNDTLGLSNKDATALAMLLGTVSLQHDTYLPWWRANTASYIEQPSRPKTTASDYNASDTNDDNNDKSAEFCNSGYYQLGRGYHRPHMEDLNTQVAALIAQGKQALKTLRIQDSECAFEYATKGKLTPEHFCQAGRVAWDQDNITVGISGLIPWLIVVHFTLQVYTAGPHCQQQPEHLNKKVMAFFTDQGMTPKPSGKEPDLIEVIVPPQ